MDNTTEVCRHCGKILEEKRFSVAVYPAIISENDCCSQSCADAEAEEVTKGQNAAA